MTFEGYPRGVQGFFEELKANNTKEWFEANRERFDELVMSPSVALVAALAEPLSELEPALSAEPKVNGSIRRIYRDTRFSKDKTPYHSYLHLIFWHGDHPNRAPGVHLVLADDHVGYGVGHWGFEPPQLEKFRADVLSDGGMKLEAAIEKVGTATDCVLEDPALKTVPRDVDKSAAGASWTRHKGIVMRTHGLAYPQELHGPHAVDYVADLCEKMQPLTRYLVENVFS